MLFGSREHGLFYAWWGAVREEGGTVDVNLLLNRASRSVLVRSWLPAEGRVEVEVRRDCDLRIRIPLWARLDSVAVRHNGQVSDAHVHGRLLEVTARAGDIVVLALPIADRTEAWHVPPVRGEHVQGEERLVQFTFRGNTVTDLDQSLTGTERDHLYTSGRLALAVKWRCEMSRCLSPVQSSAGRPWIVSGSVKRWRVRVTDRTGTRGQWEFALFERGCGVRPTR